MNGLFKRHMKNAHCHMYFRTLEIKTIMNSVLTPNSMAQIQNTHTYCWCGRMATKLSLAPWASK